MLALLLWLLTQSAMATPCTPVPNSNQAQLFRCENLNVLYLRGDPLTRARTMGELVRSGALSPVVLNYFSHKVTDLVRHSSPWLAGPVELVYNQLIRLLHRGAPPAITEELHAMAEGMGIDGIELQRALSLPDVGALTNVVGSVPFFRALPASGCTSVAKRKPDGSLVYGRNLDFAGAGIWDRHPLVTVVFPSDLAEQKRVVFGADGALFGGITGINEAGIGFAVHQNYTRAGSLRGVPMVFIGELVLRQARSLDQALEIIRAHRPAVLWTFVLTNFATGEAATVEVSPTRFAVRYLENNALAQTNHLMGTETSADEFASLGIKMNSIYRMKRALELLEQGSADPLAAIAGILNYQENPEGRLSAYHDVLKAHTIQTVLVEGSPGQANRALVSVDPAPTSGGRMANFSLAALFAGQDPPQFELVDLVKNPPAKRERQRQISDAFHLYFDQHQMSEASALLSAHNTLDSAYFTTVTLTQQGRWQEALLTAEQALANPRFLAEPAYIRQSLAWIKAASLLELGKNNEARVEAEKILAEEPTNVRLRDFADQLSRGKTPPVFMRRFSFDFFSGDLHGRAN